MKRFLPVFLVVLAGIASAADDEGFVPLFNGRDLTGWVNANCAPETWSVSEGMIHCSGHPTGALRTVRQYENFILELEWRHPRSGGNSGVFIWATPIAAPGVPFLRGIEAQVLDHGFNVPGKEEWYTTHGDVFPIHGATMKPFGRHNGMRSFPSEQRSQGSPEWNHYRLICSNGVIRLHVNGKEVSGGEACHYRKGYLGLESEGAPVDFRNLRINELPSSGATPGVTAPLDQDWRPLFTGLDLRGWKTNAVTATRWGVKGERLLLRDGPASAASTLWTENKISYTQFLLDCRVAKPAEDKQLAVPTVLLEVAPGKTIALKLEGAVPGSYQRFSITIQEREVRVFCNDKQTQQLTLPAAAPPQGPLGLCDTGGAVEFMNLYAR